MTIKKINNLFFKDQQDSRDEQYVADHQIPTKQIAWFSQMTCDENLNSNELNNVLGELEHFLDEKEFEKAEILAELQLAYAFQNVFEARRAELTKSAIFKQ